MISFVLPQVPAPVEWKVTPVDWQVLDNGDFVVTSGAATDLFNDPAGGARHDSAPAALFAVERRDFVLSACVTVAFASKFDAGVIQMREWQDVWAKLCFELSPAGKPTIVSVVNRGVSDDCNSTQIDGSTVYLRACRRGGAFAFHYSTDGRYWSLVRHFALGESTELKIGFSAQSPTGNGCGVTFSAIQFGYRTIADLRSGE